MRTQDLIRGGQGRSAEDIFDSATAWGWICFACVFAMLAVFTVRAIIG